jgi:hypothetical protein
MPKAKRTTATNGSKGLVQGVKRKANQKGHSKSKGSANQKGQSKSKGSVLGSWYSSADFFGGEGFKRVRGLQKGQRASKGSEGFKRVSPRKLVFIR